MITSYNEILNDMRNDYFDRCGKKIDLNSEAGARMQAVASELFSLACYGDYVLKQAFPQTATTKYLEKHGTMRDIKRKKSSKSSGTLRFFCSEGSQNNIRIPKGIVCSVRDNPYIQFVTTQEREIIPTESNFVDVEAESIKEGYENNVDQNTITTIVNPPAGVVSVVNTEKFIGARDEETDSSLRNRILNSYSVPPNGFNEQSIKDAVLECEGVLDCVVRPISSVLLEICVEIYGDKVSNELSNEIENKLFLKKLCEVYMMVTAAKIREYSLSVEIYKDDTINKNLDEQIRNAISEVANTIGVEQDVKLSKFVSAISTIDGVKYCEVNSDSAIQNIIYANMREVLKNNGVKVIYYD